MEPPLRVDASGVVEDPVEDGVSQGGVADNVVRVLDDELEGEDGSSVCVAIVAKTVISLVHQSLSNHPLQEVS